MAVKGTLNEYHFSNKRNEGYLYIAHNPKIKGIYKIGRTIDYQKRLVALKREYSDNLCYCYISDLLYNNVEAEEMMHCELMNEQTTDYYKGEEWFEIGDTHLEAVIEDIKRIERSSAELFELERSYYED